MAYIEMRPMNGHDAEPGEFPERDAARIAAREAAPTVPDDDAPFAQKAHDLLLQSIDSVGDNWVEQLKAVRAQNQHVEQQVLERVAKVKTDITQLYLLGNAVTLEVRHGEEFNAKIGRELEKLLEGPQ